MDSRILLMMSSIGFILMIAGFAGYVVDPGMLYLAVFVVGISALAIGYVVTLMSVRKVADDKPDE